MSSSIDANELIASSILDCNQSDASADRLSAALMTRVLGHRNFSGSGVLRFTERALWSFEGGFGDGIAYGNRTNGIASKELDRHMDSLRDGYAVVPHNPSDDRDGVVLPPLNVHLFGLYEPSLGICYLLTPELEIAFTPEAVRLLRHSVERCLLRPGAINVTQGSQPNASVTAEVDSEFFSDRQLKVLRLLANGYSNTEIGKELAISASLAKQEVAFIMHSLQARNRLDAVVKAQRRGIIPSVSAQV